MASAQPGGNGPDHRPRVKEQLLDSLRAPEIVLSEETLARLDEIWPGPGAEAPEAYAW